jgi:chromatin segregation and condensation protein Rec8/ScpA/Scc1 (kleisin family)
MSKRNREDVNSSDVLDEVLLYSPMKKQKTEQKENLEGSSPSIFKIKEMVENIIKYLSLEPMTLLNIANVSKMYAAFSILIN